MLEFILNTTPTNFVVVLCGGPADGVQTLPVDTSPSYVYGDTYTYVCNSGYEFTGSSLESTCQSDGTWSLSAPTCTGNVYDFC